MGESHTRYRLGRWAMTKHSVVIARTTRPMSAANWRWRGLKPSSSKGAEPRRLVGSRACGKHSRAIEVLDQRGIAHRFLAEG